MAYEDGEQQPVHDTHSPTITWYLRISASLAGSSSRVCRVASPRAVKASSVGAKRVATVALPEGGGAAGAARAP